jgi:hypothetical protein
MADFAETISDEAVGRRLARAVHSKGPNVSADEEAGIDPDDHDELSVVGSDGRWSWEVLGRNRVDAPTYAAAIAKTIQTRQRWHREYEAAKAAVIARAGPAPPGPAAA